MDEVMPGILHWRARHPGIGIEVSSFLLTDTATALDPILPAGEGPDWLGHDVDRVVLDRTPPPAQRLGFRCADPRAPLRA
ncbi:MAG: hypothetical protein WKF40_02075 [Thermoleophilaceae bacterium]